MTTLLLAGGWCHGPSGWRCRLEHIELALKLGSLLLEDSIKVGLRDIQERPGRCLLSCKR